MNRPENLKKVILLGASGRMGRVIAGRFLTDGKVALVGAVDPNGAGEKIGKPAGINFESLEVVRSINDLPADIKADVVLDFSVADATRANIKACLERGWDVIIGATGFNEDDHRLFKELAEKYSKRIVLVPNFTPGINLLLKIAEMAARIFPKAEIIEMHHDRKLDAPSGTAIHTAKIISEARKEGKITDLSGTEDRSRGRIENGIPIHAVRLPGLLAHQEVIFGSEGEVLTIRHDTTDRGAFLTGIYLAIERLEELKPGFTVGLGWALK
ncbi:MAG: 4-hydroxy-tetrahydrodipicolinate reductase [bacterium]|nr:4-hydroxy-tetrahydrodipicolinate reductase [bacterium]